MKAIFIVDDDETNNYIAEQMIRYILPEIEFVSFTDPADALEKLNGELVKKDDVLLVDLNMPKIDGWQFLEKFKDKNIACHIFILTTSLDPEDRKIAKNNPLVREFLLKPLSSESINVMLEAIARSK